MLVKKMGSGLILGLLLLSVNAFAQISMDYNNQPPQGQRGEQGRENGAQANSPSRVPPESAISACKSKSEGTACEVSGHNGTKQGICVYTPDNKYFACRPNDMNMSSQPPQK